MIDIGSIAYGPELERRPILHELERLSQSLRAAPEPEPSIELAFVVPGSMGHPDFKGFRLARRRGGTRHLIVYVEVPTSLAESDKPLPDLIQLAIAAIRYAVDNKPSKPGHLTESEGILLLTEMQRSAAKLGVEPSLVPDKTIQVGQPPGVDSLDMLDVEPSVEVILATTDHSAINEAFDLEERLADRLSAESVGYIDGNEVGQGVFTIFALGPEFAPLRAAVEEVVRERWSRPGATLMLHDPAREDVETLSL